AVLQRGQRRAAGRHSLTALPSPGRVLLSHDRIVIPQDDRLRDRGLAARLTSLIVLRASGLALKRVEAVLFVAVPGYPPRCRDRTRRHRFLDRLNLTPRYC